ncbi:tRNA pseudouridine(55) synthase TruB [bacterium]|nr:tRNA pseudouridine(55) synthase TruB [bacterium]
MFGFLNVYKPVGKTSHDVVAYFRKLLKIKQIGHTGTLDPFAEGVLPICIGKATRLIEYLPDNKEYTAYIQFGKSTETYDTEGKIVFESNKKITKEDLQKELKNFEGEITQLPPIYSAIKLNGKKLYEYAREGKNIEIQPRKVTIHKIKLTEFNYKTQTAQIDIECSKGTYIRSIANDLGNNLERGGYLYRLIRTKSGKFEIQNSTEMNKFTDKDFTQNKLINPIDMLNIPIYTLSTEEIEKVIHGQNLLNKSMKSDDLIILVYNNRIKAIANVNDNIINVNKVFNDD